jgi:hypothetical protein
MTPELKQIWDLSSADFEQHPVWVGVHNFDIGEPWHRGSNEGTYRPWIDALPCPSPKGFFLVRGTFRLQDGSSYPGFFTVASETWDTPPRPDLASFSSRYGGAALALVGIQQPRIFVQHQQYSFWGGRAGVPLEKRQALYSALGKSAEDTFPVRFHADSSLATGILSGEVDGFYRVISKKPVQIER